MWDVRHINNGMSNFAIIFAGVKKKLTAKSWEKKLKQI